MPAIDLELSKINISGGTQPRAAINEAVVAEYGEHYESGGTLPPLEVFFDGVEYWLADGFHRFHGGRKAKLDELPANIHQGTRRDAVLFSVGANASHGLRRSREDKRRAVDSLLADPEWSQWSAREIARRCCVSHQFVVEVRSESSNSVNVDTVSPSAAPTSGKVKFTTSTGKVAEHVAERSPRQSQFNPEEYETAAADLPPVPLNEQPTAVSAPPSPSKPPARLPAVCERAKEVSDEVRSSMKEIAHHVANILDIAERPGGERLTVTSIRAASRDMKCAIDISLYHAPCPLCSSRGCKSCLQTGWMTKAEFDRVPAESKK